MLKDLEVLNKYQHNMIDLDSHRESLKSEEKKHVHPSALLQMSFNFSESPEGLVFWKEIMKEIDHLQETKTQQNGKV